MNNWPVIAEESDICAQEFYEMWMDCVYYEVQPEADCAYDNYLEQLKIAKEARKRM